MWSVATIGDRTHAGTRPPWAQTQAKGLARAEDSFDALVRIARFVSLAREPAGGWT